jgi:hypothetical protein
MLLEQLLTRLDARPQTPVRLQMLEGGGSDTWVEHIRTPTFPQWLDDADFFSWIVPVDAVLTMTWLRPKDTRCTMHTSDHSIQVFALRR